MLKEIWVIFMHGNLENFDEKKKKVVIFGRGCIYRRYREKIFNALKVIAFIDNQCKGTGILEDGIPVYTPASIHNLEYDKILLMSASAFEMRNQLVKLNVAIDKMIHYKEVESYLLYHTYNPLEEIDVGSNSVLLLSTPVGYHGGAIALLNMAKIYLSLGYQVVVHAKTINKEFQKEYAAENLYFIEGFEGELYSKSNYKEYRKFKYIVVNTVPLILFAINLSKYREVFCWIHESKNVYQDMDKYWKEDIISKTKNENLKIFAVSELAKKNFEYYVGEFRDDIKILNYGLEENIVGKEKKSVLTFAIIGTIYPLKQQVEFLVAYSKLSEKEKAMSRVFIIGKNDDAIYYAKLKKIACNLSTVTIMPELNRKMLRDIYKLIDIVAIPSKQESLPIVAVEAMMNDRYVILTKNSGLTSYINDTTGVRFIDPFNIDDIKDALKFCLKEKNEILKRAENNNKIFRKFFSYEKIKKNMTTYGLL